jgi:NAD(P)-dependent dehydrogenase (short-subunit alcohol dehydrogenase family)
MKLKNKVAIVTGASSGIGNQIAKDLAKEGAVIAAVGRNMKRLGDVTKEVVLLGGECFPMQADLSDLSDIDTIIEQTVAKFKRIDILVNSAGIFEMADFLDIDEEMYDRTMLLNMKAVFFLCQKAAAVMIRQGKGKIINIASEGGGKIGFPQGSVYCASKGAVVALTQALAVELGPKQISVNAISPGTVRTPINEKIFEENPGFLQSEISGTPMGRIGNTGDISAAAVFLASDAADFITGIQIVVDGGFSAQ